MLMKSFISLVAVACADEDLNLLQMSAQSLQPDAGQDVTMDVAIAEEIIMSEENAPQENPNLVADDAEPPQQTDEELEDQLVEEDLREVQDIDDSNEDGVIMVAETQGLPAADVHGIYHHQRPLIRGSDIGGFLPNVENMRKCQCEGAKRKHVWGSVIYYAKGKRCIGLKPGVNFNRRMSDARFSSTDKLECKPDVQTYNVPRTCNGLRGFEAAKCQKLRSEAAHTHGSWLSAKKCMATVSTNPKMYDWTKAKDYCLHGNSYCSGIAKKTEMKKGNYVNAYTFCKDWNGRFQVANLPRTWPYGGVLEVRRKATVQLPSDAFDMYR